MATKKTTTPRIPRSKLKTTDLEGVFVTLDGRRVDEHGVDLDFKALKKYYDGKAVAERYEEPII